MSFYQDYNDKLAIEQWNMRERPSYRTIRVTPLSPALGAEVEGIDLRQEASPETVSEIRQAIGENLVLVFRDQEITAEDHKRFASHFGTLHRHLLAGNSTLSARSQDPARHRSRRSKPGDHRERQSSHRAAALSDRKGIRRRGTGWRKQYRHRRFPAIG